MIFRHFAALWLALFATTAVAQSTKADAVRDFITAYIARNKIPGAAVMVRKDEKIVRAEGYGVANLN